MSETLLSSRNLAFELYEVLDAEGLTQRERFAELDARRVRLAGGGVYVLLERQYAVRVRATGWQFRAVRCGREDAVLLGVEPDEELLSVVRLGMTVDGEVVEWRQRLVRSRHWAWQFDLKR